MDNAAIKRFWAKVDKSGNCWLWTASVDSKGYGNFSSGIHTRLAHRISHGLVRGYWLPRTVHLDHRCHNPRCVRPSHLRKATRKQNQENRGSLTSHNKSGYRGVSLHVSGKWQATVGHEGRTHYLGLFTDPAEADKVAKAKRLELFTYNDKDRITL